MSNSRIRLPMRRHTPPDTPEAPEAAPLSAAEAAEAEQQRRRFIMLIRASAAIMEKHLSPRGGAGQQLLVRAMASQAQTWLVTDIAKIEARAMLSLTRCLLLTLTDVGDSGLDDEHFMANFAHNYAELDATFYTSVVNADINAAVGAAVEASADANRAERDH